MSQERKPPFGLWATAAVLAVIATPVLYVLSAGPFAYLCAKGVLDGNLFNWFYMPLSFAGKYLPEWMIYWFVAYGNWWAELGEAVGP